MFVQMIVAGGFGLAMPFVTLYLHEELGVAMTVVGTILLLAGPIGSVGQIVGGELSDRLGRSVVLRLAIAARVVMFLATAALIAVKAHFLLVAAGFLAVRFTGSVLGPPVRAIVADVARGNGRTSAYGLLRIGTNVGWAAGPALGGLLVGTVGYASAFLAAAVASAAALLLAKLAIRETAARPEAEKFQLRGVLRAGRDRPFLVFCLLSMAMYLLVGQFSGTLTVFASEHVHVTKPQIGQLYMLNGLMVVLLQWPATALAGRMGGRAALVAGCLLYAAGYASLATATSLAWLLASMAIITAGEVLFMPTSSTEAANLAPPGMMGRYMGFIGLAETVGWALGPFVGGVLLDLWPHQPLRVWLPLASLGLIGAAGFALRPTRATAPR
jgi:MFS family permease